MNVANFAIKLGIDPSSIPADLQKVDVNLSSAQKRLAADMKSTAAQGVTSFRLLSESLDLGLSRPLTRYLTQTFPAFSAGLAGIVPVAAFGALSYYAVEAFERIGKKMDEAKQKQEAYLEAVRKTAQVSEQAAAESQKTFFGLKAKGAELDGDKAEAAKYKALQANAEAAEKMAKFVDQLTNAERRELEASLALMPVWARLGSIWHQIWASDAELQVEKVGQTLKDFQQQYAHLSLQDALKGTAAAATLLDDQLNAAKRTVAQMEADQGKVKVIPSVGLRAPPITVPLVAPGALEAEKARRAALQAMKDQADRDAKNAALQGDNAGKEKAKDLAARHAEELRNEIAAIQRLTATSRAQASAAELAAAATGKGTQASIAAAAAAEAEKRIADFQAEAATKYSSNTNDKTAAAALAAAIPVIREAALAEQTAKATAEFHRAVAEFNTKSAERLATLRAEAEGHGKVAAEQAKQAEGLVKLRELYEGLYGKSVPAPAPMIGPPSQQQNDYAALQAAQAGLGIEQAGIQAHAFAEELKKIQARTAEIAGAGVSPWAKIDAQVVELTRNLRGLGQSEKEVSDQATHLRQALGGEQNARIGSEFEKMAEKLREAHTELNALAAGDPYAKLAAEAQKLGREWGLEPGQIAMVRQALIELQDVQNTGKAWEGVDSLNASGAKMQELRAQMAALQAAAASGKTSDGVALSPDALAAVRLEMQQIQDEEDKIALKTGGANAGFKAWLDDLQKVESEGQFVFNALTQATKGFEDTAANSLVKIIETHRGHHLQLIHELRQMWEGYFAGIAKMAIQHGMQKLLQPVGGILGKLGIGGAGKAGADATLLTAGHSLSAAAAALMSAAAALRAGGGGGFAIPGIGGAGGDAAAPTDGGGDFLSGLMGYLPGRAGGGDVTPGQDYVVGERGPEILRMGGMGGSIIPNSGGGGETHNHYYDLSHAVVTPDVISSAQAAVMNARSEERAVVRAVSMSKENSLRSRPAR